MLPKIHHELHHILTYLLEHIFTCKHVWFKVRIFDKPIRVNANLNAQMPKIQCKIVDDTALLYADQKCRGFLFAALIFFGEYVIRIFSR